MINKETEKTHPALLDYLTVLAKWRKFIITVVFGASFLTAVFSLIMPKTFKSTAVIVPAQGTAQLNVYETLSSSLFGAGFPGGSTDILLLKAILESRTIKEDLVTEFNLIEVYDASNMDEALRTLSDQITTTITEDNTLEVSFKHSTGWFAFGKKKEEPVRLFVQRAASRVVYMLDELNRTYQAKEAKSYREFIEARTKEIHKNLIDLENRLTQFQELHDVSYLDAQLQATLEAAVLLEAEVIKQELEYALAKAKVGPDSPMAKNLDAELAAAKAAFRQSMGTSDNDTRYLLGYDRDLPELMKEYLRLRRDISIQSEVFKYITTKYEEAKLKEVQDTPTIMVLDYPKTPDLRAAPRRAFMVITVMICITILTVILAFVLDSLDQMRQEYPEQFNKFISG